MPQRHGETCSHTATHGAAWFDTRRPDGVAHADGERAARNNVGDERLEAGVKEAGQVGRSVHVRRLVVHDHLAKGLQQVRGARVAANDEPVGKLEPQRQHGRVNVVVLSHVTVFRATPHVTPRAPTLDADQQMVPGAASRQAGGGGVAARAVAELALCRAGRTRRRPKPCASHMPHLRATPAASIRAADRASTPATRVEAGSVLASCHRATCYSGGWRGTCGTSDTPRTRHM